MNGFSWLRELRSTADLTTTDLQFAPDVASPPIAEVAKAGVVSLPIRPAKLKTRSFFFPPPGAWRQPFSPPSATAGDSPARRPDAKWKAPSSTTRIAPPQDVVKLEDRLMYVLQPPLETI